MTQNDSTRLLKMALRTDRRGRPSTPDGYGKNTGRCGDTVEVFLRIQGDCVRSLHYEADGCLNTRACAHALSELVTGKTLDDAWQVRPDHLIEYLENLPADHHHCAELVVGALYKALCDWAVHTRRQWTRLYLRQGR